MEGSASEQGLRASVMAALGLAQHCASRHPVIGRRLLRRVSVIVGAVAKDQVPDAPYTAMVTNGVQQLVASLETLLAEPTAQHLDVCLIEIERLEDLLTPPPPTLVVYGNGVVTEAAPRGEAPPALASRDERRLEQLASSYGVEAGVERLRERVAMVVAAASLTVGLVLAWRAVGWSSTNGKLVAGPYLGYMAVCSTLVVASAVAFFIARRHARARREALRLQRQISGLSAYLSPLPPEEQALLRGTMLQRLFPRLLDDTDPLREQELPGTDSLLAAIRMHRPAEK